MKADEGVASRALVVVDSSFYMVEVDIRRFAWLFVFDILEEFHSTTQ